MSLRVVTWNVGRLHFGRWLGGAHDSRASDDDMAEIARRVVALDADVVALQELAGPHQCHLLLAHLGDAWSGAAAEPELFDRTTAIVARRSLASGFEGVATSSGRRAVAAILDGAVVLALHVDAWRSRVRAQQIAELVEWSLARAEPLVLLAGDLNIDLDHPVTQDAHDRAIVRLLDKGFADLGGSHGPTWCLGRRLDYVLARRPSPRALHARLAHALRLPLGDHFPLVVDVDKSV
jgi:endonuclease/exonuclease/phosphatase family metal-dependent hydrolase